MKKYKVVFWLTAGIMMLWFGIGPLFAYDDPDSLQVIQRLGYPLYFSPMLTCFKVLGVIAVVVPLVPDRLKEWAYAGFGIDLICAIIGFLVVDGFGSAEVFLPVTALFIVVLNYFAFDKLKYVHT
ncbi:MAG: DoxX family protein [Niastella sp.]|nr:DoxX family protein [Niastella sp.]